MRPRDDARERLLAALLRLARRHQDERGGAVVDAGGVARRHRAFLVEGRPQLADRVESGAVLGIFVGVDDDVALARLDRDRDDLILELAGLLRGLGLVLRFDREVVLLLARDLILLGDVLRRVAHVVAVEGIPQAVLDHGVDHVEVAHLHAVAQMGAMRGHAHGFLAARDDDVGIAVEDRLVAERDGAQARAAQLVDAPSGALDRNAGADRRLARGVLALPGAQDLAQDDFRDLAAFDAGPLERGLDGDLSEVMGGQRGERPVEGADCCARRRDDDDVVLHHKAPLFRDARSGRNIRCPVGSWSRARRAAPPAVVRILIACPTRPVSMGPKGHMGAAKSLIHVTPRMVPLPRTPVRKRIARGAETAYFERSSGMRRAAGVGRGQAGTTWPLPDSRS